MSQYESVTEFKPPHMLVRQYLLDSYIDTHIVANNHGKLMESIYPMDPNTV